MTSLPTGLARRRPRRSLADAVTFANALLVVAALLLAAIATAWGPGLDEAERLEILLGSLAVAVLLLVNLTVLRRRLAPLAALAERVEAADPGAAEPFEPPHSGFDEVDRLGRAFAGLVSRIEAERRRAGRLVLKAQEDERARIARDLHDEVNQDLTAISLRLALLGEDAPEELRGELAGLAREVGGAQRELLALARQLRPPMLDELGLEAALAEHVRRFRAQTGLAAELSVSGSAERLPPESEVAVYRVAQEALANVARHARASRVDLRLEAREGHAHLVVRDDGRGMGGRRGSGLGLSGMSERARLAGGRLEVWANPVGGTIVELHI